MPVGRPKCLEAVRISRPDTPSGGGGEEVGGVGEGNNADVATGLVTHIRNESFECALPERDKLAFRGSVAWKLKNEKEKGAGFGNPLCFVRRIVCFVKCSAALVYRHSLPYTMLLVISCILFWFCVLSEEMMNV
jgi:hypothetical protein